MVFWNGKRVLLTGHTGFKGAWLGLWLASKGAHVTGLALEPDTDPALFLQLDLARDVEHCVCDIRDAGATAAIVRATKPDVVLHLAAQALVLRSYRLPLDTWSVNVMGTANVLEAARHLDHTCAVVAITTDKVYRNNEWEFGYRETDHLGGHDPYSASKAATEIVIESWRNSYLGGTSPVRLASARAGNVIGGGDWSENRILPDIVRALSAGRAIEVRSPAAIRPWQHVLEPLAGYLTLAEQLYMSSDTAFQDAFNFGPSSDAERPVRDLVAAVLETWHGKWRDASDPKAAHEAGRLALNIDRARVRLGWTPRWSFKQAVDETIEWYRTCQGSDTAEIRAATLSSIARFEAAA